MENQTLSLSTQSKIPEKWRERFLIKRIDEEDIEITLEERNFILNALNEGSRFIQIGKYTLMLNAIKSIDPLWGANNIPPRPEEITELVEVEDHSARLRITNQKEIDLWDQLFRQKTPKEQKCLTK